MSVSDATEGGLSRRQMINRSAAVVGATVAWSLPVVQSLPASALVPAGSRPGNENPGGENPGGENPGGENPGGENPGGENPGGQNPGGEQPRGVKPGGEVIGGSRPPAGVAGVSETLPVTGTSVAAPLTGAVGLAGLGALGIYAARKALADEDNADGSPAS